MCWNAKIMQKPPIYRASNIFESVSHASGDLSGKRPPEMKSNVEIKAAFWKNEQKQDNPGHSIPESILSEEVHNLDRISTIGRRFHLATTGHRQG